MPHRPRTGPHRSLPAGLGGLVVLVSVLLTLLGLGAAASAQPDHPTTIPHYAAAVTVDTDGTLHVAEAVTYDFGGVAVQQVERVLQTRERYDDDDDRVYDVRDVAVDAVQSDVDATVRSDRDSSRITARFAEPQSQQVTIDFSYDVTGAVARTPDGIEVRWPVVQGFSAPIADATLTWKAPQVNWLSCLAGAPGSSRPCTTTQLADVSAPRMTQQGLSPGDQMVGILGLPDDAGVAPSVDLQPRWSLTRAFTASGRPLWLALAVLVLGVLAALAMWWLRGRDKGTASPASSAPIVGGEVGAGGAGERVVFAPPSACRPGQMGTLVDEHADIVDVTSTVIDLAVRNYLFIEELPHGEYGRNDWMLRRRHDAGEELLGYEREVFEALFADGDEVKVSQLDDSLRERLPGVQSLMYEDMVSQGWFGERPDSVRSRWTTAGWVLAAAGVVLTVVLALASTFGLVGVAVVLAGVAFVTAGLAAPARTSRGSKVLVELAAFRRYLEHADASDYPESQRQELIARCYPYALVFGLGERWAQAL
ncbi:MAG: DUF2207 domain-containing protein, partial [Nocardioidaceae bacterium]